MICPSTPSVKFVMVVGLVFAVVTLMASSTEGVAEFAVSVAVVCEAMRLLMMTLPSLLQLPMVVDFGDSPEPATDPYGSLMLMTHRLLIHVGGPVPPVSRPTVP